MNPDLVPDAPPDPAARLGRLLALAAALVLVSIPLRIVAHGWLPQDDVRRHAAKVFAERDWSEILLLRPELTVDLHAGWHALLAGAARLGADSPRALAVVSIAVPAALFLITPLLRFRRSEAWILALAAVALLEPAFYPRLLSGRPLVVSMTALALLAASWSRLEGAALPLRAMAGATLLFAFAIWAHGNWYLWLLPLFAFFIAGTRHAARRLAACWLAGAAIAACLTGNPIGFLSQWLSTVIWSFGSHDLTRHLVTEFQPGQGAGALALGVALLLVWRRGALSRSPATDPVFLLAVGAWVLGLAVSRFWSDWGIPPLLVWIARQLESALEPLDRKPFERTALATGALLVLFLSVAGNRGERWTSREGDRHLRVANPEHAAWLPSPGGVLYSASMGLFYDTFFENPRAPFRYAVGFEPGLMPPPELAIFREIQRQGASDRSFLPWVRKLRPEDRLAIARPGGPAPRIPGLEWYEPFAGLWLGRLGPVPPATP